jgi:hypothetical protein
MHAVVVLLAEYATVFHDAEVEFTQSANKQHPGFHAPQQPRQVHNRIKWLRGALADIPGHLPETCAAGYQDAAAKFLAAALESALKHQIVWLRMPLLLDALASSEAALLAAGLLDLRAPRHDLLEHFDESEFDFAAQI